MTGQQLKNSILQAAVKGELVPNLIPSDEKYGEALLNEIKRKKESIYNKGLERKSTKIATKESLTDYIFEIPDNWIWCRLGDLCHIAGRIGFRGYTKADIVTSGGAVSLSPSNIIDGFISFSRYTMISMEKYDESPEIKVRDGEIVFTKTASIGKCAYIETVPMPTTINPQMVVMKHICCNAKYLTFALQSPYAVQNYNAFVIGTSIPTFSQAVLESLLIPLPPLSIQKAIVSKIEELLPLVDEYDKVSVELNTLNDLLPDKLRKSVLQDAVCGRLVPQDSSEEPAIELIKRIRKEKNELVKAGKIKKKDLEVDPILSDEYPFEKPLGWEFARLSEISLDSADGPFGSNLKKEHYIDQKQVRIIQLSNIGEFGWRDSNVKYTSFEHLKTISRSEAFAGDIIIAKMMPAGRAIICPNADTKYVLSSDAVRFAFSSILDKRYLYYAINSPVFKDQVYGEVQGITRVRTSLSKLRTYILPIPPLSEQKRIVEKIEEAFSAIDKLNA